MSTSRKPLTYAGIGARLTPIEIRNGIQKLAERLALQEWHLATGGAMGADRAFELGAPVSQRTIYLPWPGYNWHEGMDCVTLSEDTAKAAAEIAKYLHPAWAKCSSMARKFHVRNVAILLGPDLDEPVDAVIAWTLGGTINGGTSMGLWVAAEYDIPKFNLGGSVDFYDVLDALGGIQDNRTKV